MASNSKNHENNDFSCFQNSTLKSYQSKVKQNIPTEFLGPPDHLRLPFSTFSHFSPSFYSIYNVCACSGCVVCVCEKGRMAGGRKWEEGSWEVGKMGGGKREVGKLGRWEDGSG